MPLKAQDKTAQLNCSAKDLMSVQTWILFWMIWKRILKPDYYFDLQKRSESFYQAQLQNTSAPAQCCCWPGVTIVVFGRATFLCLKACSKVSATNNIQMQAIDAKLQEVYERDACVWHLQLHLVVAAHFIVSHHLNILMLSKNWACRAMSNILE